MASFKVEHTTSLSKDEAFKKVRSYLEGDSLKKLDKNLEYSFDDSNYSGSVKGSMFSCAIQLTGDQPAKVTIDVKLGLLASAFKGKIQETLQSKMGQLLG